MSAPKTNDRISRLLTGMCRRRAISPQPLDLGLLRLYLTPARKGLRRIGRDVPYPIAQPALVQITRRLRS